MHSHVTRNQTEWSIRKYILLSTVFCSTADRPSWRPALKFFALTAKLWKLPSTILTLHNSPTKRCTDILPYALESCQVWQFQVLRYRRYSTSNSKAFHPPNQKWAWSHQLPVAFGSRYRWPALVSYSTISELDLTDLNSFTCNIIITIIHTLNT